MIETKKDGGPAFPCSNDQFTYGNPSAGDTWPGLSLRDYFAGQALAGAYDVLAWSELPEDYEETAKRAYQLADAMLAAREVRP